MSFLLDVNVLIALIDPAHVAHDIAHNWFESTGRTNWATCPLTENGVIRIVGHPKYSNTPGSPAAVAAIIGKLRKLPGHTFWPDDLSLVDSVFVDTSLILTSGRVTDTYLIALASAHGGQLATLDRRISGAAVKGGRSAIHSIGHN